MSPAVAADVIQRPGVRMVSVKRLRSTGSFCNLKPQQRDLTPVLRRPVEPAGQNGQPYHNSSLIWCSYQRVVVSITSVEAGSMKLLMGLLAAMLLLAGVGTSHAVVRIANDRGGQIGRYVERYEQLRATGQTVMIDGLCASSCTIVLGAIPHEKICVTRNANLAFHAAWDFGAHGQAITNPGATRMLYSMYPSQVRHWIANRGGLSPRMIFLRGRQLEAMYRPCYLDAQVAAPR